MDIPAVVAGDGGRVYDDIIKHGCLPVYSFYIPSGSVGGGGDGQWDLGGMQRGKGHIPCG